MLAITTNSARLYVAGWAHLQMNPCAAKVIDEGRIFHAAYSMADAGRLRFFERFPHALCPPGLPGMCGTRQPMFHRVPKRRHLRLDRETLFVTRDIKSYDAASLETFDQPGGLEPLRGGEMPQGAQDETRLNASGADACLRRAVDRRHDGLGPHAALGMKRGRETHFRVDDAVASELFEHILDDESQRVLVLHELKATRGTSEEIGQAGALRRSDEFTLVLLLCNGRGEPGYNGIAK